MDLKSKWILHDHYFKLVTILFLLTGVTGVVLYLNDADWKISLPLLGGLISFIFVIQKQKLEEARFVNERFVEFNARYDNLNEALNAIVERKGSQDLSREERDRIFDYFNLCAEEYLFYTKGYVYPEVWEAWESGMTTYFDDKEIFDLWEAEGAKQSYYGLTNVIEEMRKSGKTFKTPKP